MIAETLLLALFNALMILGIHRATHYDRHPNRKGKGADRFGVMEDTKMLLWRVRFEVENLVGPFWSKPLVSCPVCMASVHSLYVFWPYAVMQHGWSPVLIFAYLLYIPVVSTGVAIIQTIEG